MNAIAKVEQTALSALTESELARVLQTSLYPGATLDSIKLVLSYCKAAGLDPMQKPVHIVPMSVKKAGTTNQYEMRDVVMPGIGLYRTQAARTGQFAGISEPEFGPEKVLKVGDFEFTYPEWCRVSIERALADGSKAVFTAKEFWIENYATMGRDSQVPNAMWKKRPRGQLAKCAQAQALRMAFPEMTGSQPTADEMEGRSIDEPGSAAAVVIEASSTTTTTAQTYPQDKFDANLAAWTKKVADGRATADRLIEFLEAQGAPLTEAQKKQLRDLPAPPKPETRAADEHTDVTPKVTYADVADKLTKATDADALALAGDLIKAVPDEQQRKELQAIYDRREGELAAG